MLEYAAISVALFTRLVHDYAAISGVAFLLGFVVGYAVRAAISRRRRRRGIRSGWA